MHENILTSKYIQKEISCFKKKTKTQLFVHLWQTKYRDFDSFQNSICY